MVEMLLSAVPFGDVNHTGDAILGSRKQQLAGYGVGQYEYSFTVSDNEIVLVDTVFPCVHMSGSRWFLQSPLPASPLLIFLIYFHPQLGA